MDSDTFKTYMVKGAYSGEVLAFEYAGRLIIKL